MNTQYILNFYKCRNVKSPEKFGKAAGWDFYIPEDLCIQDFINNLNIYTNEYLDLDWENNKVLTVPLTFYVKYQDKVNAYNIIYTKDAGTNTINWYLQYKYKSTDIVDIFLNHNKIDETELQTVLNIPVEKINIWVGSKVLIPSGIHVKLPENVILVAENKSGIASKRGLIKAAQVIDVDYEGQIHINLINATNYATFIKPGDKIVQFVPYFQPNMFESKEYTSKEELYKDSKSIRGEGGFGSSDKQ